MLRRAVAGAVISGLLLATLAGDGGKVSHAAPDNLCDLFPQSAGYLFRLVPPGIAPTTGGFAGGCQGRLQCENGNVQSACKVSISLIKDGGAFVRARAANDPGRVPLSGLGEDAFRDPSSNGQGGNALPAPATGWELALDAPRSPLPRIAAMLVRVLSSAVVGLDGELVQVEVDISRTSAEPRTLVVGLPDTAFQESKERVRAAVRNSGLSYPAGSARSPAT